MVAVEGKKKKKKNINDCLVAWCEGSWHLLHQATAIERAAIRVGEARSAIGVSVSLALARAARVVS